MTSAAARMTGPDDHPGADTTAEGGAGSDPAADPGRVRACTISRDVQNFDLLIEDMDAVLGADWGDLDYGDARAFLDMPEAGELEFIAIAMDESDEANVGAIASLIRAAQRRDVKVIVIAEEVSPQVLHQLLKTGANEFVPYPLPEGELAEAIERLRAPPPQPAAPPPAALGRAPGRPEGIVLPVQGLAGGVGATTFAVNLAWELATIDGKSDPRVCLVDLDLQQGSVATYLDLPRREAVYELLSDTDAMDADAFMQALQPHGGKLHVLTAPSDMLPLDIVTPEDIERVIDAARSRFDYVVIDMPSTVVQWTETVLAASSVYFALIHLDMRSAQNALRFIRTLKAEDLPFEKLRFALNRAPKFTDFNGKARVKRLAESLDIALDVQLPDAGRTVFDAAEQGQTLAEAARKNPLRREIRKLARAAHDAARDAATAS